MGQKTRRSEQKAFMSKAPASSGTDIVAYTYSTNDAFVQSIMAQRAPDYESRFHRISDGDPGSNDDFYRHSSVSVKKDLSSPDGRRYQLSLARQLATKEDKEAVIRLVTRSNVTSSETTKKKKALAPLINVVPPYTKFFLENVSESRTEKAQIVETFGEFIAFFFGKHPEVYQFSGRLLNTKNHDWKNDFQEMYDEFLRGTKAVEHDATVFIQYDDVMAEGFLMSSSVNYTGVSNNECQFAFAMLVTDRAPVNQIQRLRDRRSRSRFSYAENQLLNDLSKLRDEPIPFSLMQKALSAGGLDTSDIVLMTKEKKKIIPSNTGTGSTSAS